MMIPMSKSQTIVITIRMIFYIEYAGVLSPLLELFAFQCECPGKLPPALCLHASIALTYVVLFDDAIKSFIQILRVINFTKLRKIIIA